MLIIESILGNIRDKQWQDRAGKAKVDYLILNQWDAQKKPPASNIRTRQ